jgi:hypothetical protein
MPRLFSSVPGLKGYGYERDGLPENRRTGSIGEGDWEAEARRISGYEVKEMGERLSSQLLILNGFRLTMTYNKLRLCYY